MNIAQVFQSSAASPAQILLAREARSARQSELLGTGCQSLVSFTLNIPGSVKQFPLGQAAFSEGLAQLRIFLSNHILHEESAALAAGSEALLTLSLSPEEAKRVAVSIEDLHPLGRLFDIDVLAPDGHALSRSDHALPRRKCLICGQDAKICSRTQAHPIQELQNHIAEILISYFREKAAQCCSVQAARSLLSEVSATPKPGLVDRENSGSHLDMDFFTFLDSSAALSPWFAQMFRVGWDHCALDASDLFPRLRFVGRQAEAAMFQATNGVNTHKGLIFSFGLLCGAMGAICARKSAPAPLSDVLSLCGEMGACACRDFSGSSDATNGLNCYRVHQITGIRGEAASGFPSAAQIGLPTLQQLRAAGWSLNDAAAVTLLHLLANVCDTNMIKRGGISISQECRLQAKELLASASGTKILDDLKRLDRQYIRKNLSPGGCADLLSISLMLYYSLDVGLLS